MTAFCPHCGTDMVADRPIDIGEFTMHGAGFPLIWRKKEIGLTEAEAGVVWTLMKAFPKSVALGTILERLDSEAESLKAVEVFVCRIRKKLRDAKAPDPIRPARAQGVRGYKWE